MLVLAMQFSRADLRPDATEAAHLENGTADEPVHQLGESPRVRGRNLLRKEVIQPHLPVRLPCYDFTPIADPTFDSSLPKGLGHRLRALPTFVV